MKDLETRACGAVHPKGVVCTRNVYVEPGCCTEKVYNHSGPHIYRDHTDTITHMWEAVLVVKDLPFNAYTFDEG